MEVFISYSRKTSDIANKIKDLISNEGHDAWIDIEGIYVSDEWKKTLAKNIKKADCIIIVHSEYWETSENCKWEYYRAIDLGKKIIPIWLDGIPEGKPISKLHGITWSDLQNPEYSQVFFNNLEEIAKQLNEQKKEKKKGTTIKNKINIKL